MSLQETIQHCEICEGKCKVHGTEYSEEEEYDEPESSEEEEHKPWNPIFIINEEDDEETTDLKRSQWILEGFRNTEVYKINNLIKDHINNK